MLSSKGTSLRYKQTCDRAHATRAASYENEITHLMKTDNRIFKHTATTKTGIDSQYKYANMADKLQQTRTASFPSATQRITHATCPSSGAC